MRYRSAAQSSDNYGTCADTSEQRSARRFRANGGFGNKRIDYFQSEMNTARRPGQQPESGRYYCHKSNDYSALLGIW